MQRIFPLAAKLRLALSIHKIHKKKKILAQKGIVFLFEI
jgi:hypothetical protein